MYSSPHGIVLESKLCSSPPAAWSVTGAPSP
jgi:hypothetical protein